MKPNDDYKVCIWGTTVSKLEANRIGITIIIGFIAAFVSALIFGTQNKVTVFYISLISVALAYFGVAKKIFKDNQK